MSEEEDDDEQKEPMLKESFGKRKRFFHSISVLKTVLWRKVSCSGKNFITAGKVESIAIGTQSSRGNTGFMFSIYIACLILGFFIDTENTATAVIAFMSSGL